MIDSNKCSLVRTFVCERNGDHYQHPLLLDLSEEVIRTWIIQLGSKENTNHTFYILFPDVSTLKRRRMDSSQHQHDHKVKRVQKWPSGNYVG